MKTFWHILSALWAFGVIVLGAVVIGRGSVSEDASAITCGVVAVAVGTSFTVGLLVKEVLGNMLLQQQQGNKNSSEEKNHQTEV